MGHLTVAKLEMRMNHLMKVKLNPHYHSQG